MKFHLQKLFPKNLKIKNSGISLLMALGISTLVMGISYATVKLVTKSIERNASIERSNQVFYTAESGIEAAFFHHNARGAGTEFITDGETSQEIEHSEVGASVYWKIDGRESPLQGTLGENQVIQIPLFWDDSLSPSDSPNRDGRLPPNEDFILAFQNTDIPAGFDFGNIDSEILIDWSLLRKNELLDDEVQTFIPTDTDCTNAEIGFICDDEVFLSTTSIDSGDTTDGKIYPGTIDTTLSAFFTKASTKDFQLKFQTVLPFQNTSGEEISAIPFTLETDTTDIPKSSYTISANILIGDYSRTIRATIPENTSIGAFSYVIFD